MCVCRSQHTPLSFPPLVQCFFSQLRPSSPRGGCVNSRDSRNTSGKLGAATRPGRMCMCKISGVYQGKRSDMRPPRTGGLPSVSPSITSAAQPVPEKVTSVALSRPFTSLDQEGGTTYVRTCQNMPASWHLSSPVRHSPAVVVRSARSGAV